MNRRSFLSRSLAGLGLWHHTLTAQDMQSHAMGPHDGQQHGEYPDSAHIPLIVSPSSLTPFVDPLPIPEKAMPIGAAPNPADPNMLLPLYRIEMQQREVQIHRDLKPTRIWSYGTSLPGPTFETRSGQGLLVDWKNSLPTKHFLPIDHGIHGAEADKPEVRTVVHVHGAIVPPESDGYPEDWFVPGKSARYYYPNAQEAAMLWYHDHTMGIERLNVYAGLFGVFFVRDAVEDALNLPSGEYEIPLVLTDRMIGHDGQLYYPVSLNNGGPWIPEFFGNLFLVNGKLLPYLEVAPRKYRFRVLNAANARFFRLTLPANPDSPVFHQIGTDQGLLVQPVEVKRLALAPGERADLIVDFSAHAGTQIVMKNDALPLMQFRVSSPKTIDTSAFPAILRPLKQIEESQAVTTRILTLNEYMDPYGRPMTMLLNGQRWHEPVTEKPLLNTVEIWSLLNLTTEVHPIHLHQARVQILDRQGFDAAEYLRSRQIRTTGQRILPEANESGWKDTVRANGRSITRIIVRFEGYPGRYLWHCHILEHSAKEMMRPFEILAPT
jgi:spore coat protein A, manganese oxidase